MKRWLSAHSSLACALLLLGCAGEDATGVHDSPQTPTPGAPEPEAVARLAATWQSAREHGASCVALVRHQGQVLGTFEAGSSHREPSAPNTRETAFDIGSITKQFTGAAIMHLHEQGQLDLQATLGELLDDVPADKANISVHQLLTHTAGFAGALGYDDEPIVRDEYLARAWQRPLSAEPGTLHHYSNTGYSILGAIIEELTGRSYEAYLEDELLRPAGLHDTGYIDLGLEPSRVAVGYLSAEAEGEEAEGEEPFDDPLERPHAPDGYYWNLRANGGLLSTLGDLTRWSDALLGGEVLGPDALATYLTPHVREGLGSDGYYAYGWAISDTEAGRLIWHDGGNGFFFADVRRYVDADLLVIVLCNEDSDAASRLPVELAHAVLPELPSADELPEPPPLAIDREETLEGSTTSFVESVDVGAEQGGAIAGFFAELVAGRVRYRVRAPDGAIFIEGESREDELLERLVAIPARVGRWQLEVDAEGATGDLFFAWAWD
ncbi:MAG TPA: serine hydrolase domain-containing protein [Polyangiaceae bacterium]|nr:serine hydrolase domain-containing protein [Polyangiaceae bacterium]